MTPTREFPVSQQLDAALVALQYVWPVLRPGTACPFDNNAERFDCAVFSAHAYSWAEEDQPWNFRWRDVQVRWYKYLGRGMSANRPVTDAEVRELLTECLQALTSGNAA